MRHYAPCPHALGPDAAVVFSALVDSGLCGPYAPDTNADLKNKNEYLFKTIFVHLEHHLQHLGTLFFYVFLTSMCIISVLSDPKFAFLCHI